MDEEAKKAVEAGSKTRHFLTSLKEEILYDEEIVEVEWKGKGGLSFVRSLEDGEWKAVELFDSGQGSDDSPSPSDDAESAHAVERNAYDSLSEASNLPGMVEMHAMPSCVDNHRISSSADDDE